MSQSLAINILTPRHGCFFFKQRTSRSYRLSNKRGEKRLYVFPDEGKPCLPRDTLAITLCSCTLTMIIVGYRLAGKLNTQGPYSCTFRRWNARSDEAISLGLSYSINAPATHVHVIPNGFTFTQCVWRARCLLTRDARLENAPLIAMWTLQFLLISTDASNAREEFWNLKRNISLGRKNWRKEKAVPFFLHVCYFIKRNM